jgi:hypothetical protein
MRCARSCGIPWPDGTRPPSGASYSQTVRPSHIIGRYVVPSEIGDRSAGFRALRMTAPGRSGALGLARSGGVERQDDL